MALDENAIFNPPAARETELQGLLRQTGERSDAAFSEKLWNVAVQAYLRTHGARPALN